jgi:hypothetical protein
VVASPWNGLVFTTVSTHGAFVNGRLCNLASRFKQGRQADGEKFANARSLVSGRIRPLEWASPGGIQATIEYQANSEAEVIW